MKALMLTLALTISGLAVANSGLGELDMKECECKTCLIENGKCIKTHANDGRYIPDKSGSSAKAKGKKGSKAISQ